MNIITLAYKTIEQVNGTGITGLLQVDAQAINDTGLPYSFAGIILTVIFAILSITSYFATQRRFGRGDMPASCAVAGLVTVGIAFLMSLIPNFISTGTIVTCIILEILFAAWLFTSRE